MLDVTLTIAVMGAISQNTRGSLSCPPGPFQWHVEVNFSTSSFVGNFILKFVFFPTWMMDPVCSLKMINLV
jgi:hypothetical protein